MKVIKIRWITSYFWKIFHSVNSLFSIFNPTFSLIYHPCVEIYAYSSVCVSFLLYSVYYVSDSTVFMCPSLCLCVSLSVMPVFNLYNCLGRHTKVVFLVVGPLRSGDTPPHPKPQWFMRFQATKKKLFMCVFPKWQSYICTFYSVCFRNKPGTRGQASSGAKKHYADR